MIRFPCFTYNEIEFLIQQTSTIKHFKINKMTSIQISKTNHVGFLVDIVIYLSVMFLVREIYFTKLHFLVNGLFWSLTTFIIATWRMKARSVSWKQLGLYRPESIWKCLGISMIAAVAAIASIILFNILIDIFSFSLTEDTSNENAVSKFGNLEGNWTLFFIIMPAVLLESFFEEILERGFLLNWVEKLISKPYIATIIAVLFQAAIFGFRHSNDLSERSITTGLIGLTMGIVYVTTGRNLWPIIIAHCLLNTFSMIDRV